MSNLCWFLWTRVVTGLKHEEESERLSQELLPDFLIPCYVLYWSTGLESWFKIPDIVIVICPVIKGLTHRSYGTKEDLGIRDKSFAIVNSGSAQKIGVRLLRALCCAPNLRHSGAIEADQAMHQLLQH